MATQKTILVVDDEVSTLELMREALNFPGYAIETAENGAQAWKFLQGRNGEGVPLVITDLVMPKVDGMELARKVRATYPGIRVLFISGYADDIVFQNQDVEGATGFLPKPFSVDSLRERVREFLGQR
jgi:two-component system cell cycle sensor histidine kinase/response regulator CckA